MMQTNTLASVALCSAPTLELLEETFQFILTDVKEQDYPDFFSNLSLNRRTKRRVAQFMMNHFDKVGSSNNNSKSKSTTIMPLDLPTILRKLLVEYADIGK